MVSLFIQLSCQSRGVGVGDYEVLHFYVTEWNIFLVICLSLVYRLGCLLSLYGITDQTIDVEQTLKYVVRVRTRIYWLKMKVCLINKTSVPEYAVMGASLGAYELNYQC